MKSLFLLFFLCFTLHAQDYVGTYEAVPPYPLKDQSAQAWEMSKIRIEILTDRIILGVGQLLPNVTNITYTKEGSFILAKQKRDSGDFFIPIYIFDKDTIFAESQKLTRVAGNIKVATP